MRAFVMTRYGGPAATSLQDVEKPRPGPREVLVRVLAAGLNPVDYKTRQGEVRVIRRYRLPVVLGSELAGTVEALGAETTRFREGDQIFARVDKGKLGAFAEYACVHEDLAARFPPALAPEVAAGVPLAGLTALQGLRDELALAPGQRVFIPGGAGGVGTFALQIARWLGAEVATTASPRGEALVRRLGAHVVVDYTSKRFEEELREYDGAMDLVGGDTLMRSFAVVKRGGTVVSIAGLPEPMTARKDLHRGAGWAAFFWLLSLRIRMRAARHGVRYRYLFMRESGAELDELAALLGDGRLEVVVDRVFPFAEIGDAMAYLEAGRAKGKVVVRMT